MNIILNLLGIVVLLLGTYLFSSSKKDVNKQLIIKSLIIQFVIAFILVKFPFGRVAVQTVSDIVTKALSYGSEGISFMFGSLGDSSASTGSIFAIQVLANIVFISALVAALYYLGVIGFIVKAIGGAVGRVIGTSKVESFVAVANMFLGQTESPILVSKYLNKMTKSEIMLVLISGMGSMSATVLMGYSALGIPMEYLLIAGSLVPLGSIIISKILLPETEKATSTVVDVSGDSSIGEAEYAMTAVEDEVTIDNKGDNANLISAISQGAMDGINLALGIGASLLAIIGLVSLVNGGLGVVGLSLEKILSYLFYPIGFLMGIPKENILTASQLLGSKLVLNEFVAFGQLGEIINTLDYRSGLMMAISLAGFANIGSIGSCLSGMAIFCPEKKNLLAKLAFKGMIGGFLVSLLSSLIVGLIAAI